MKPQMRISLQALSLVGFCLGIALGFNSCSDVGFSNAVSEAQKCEGADCPAMHLVDYDDTFTIPRYSNKADILLVLDNSGSMNEDLKKLADKLDGLIQVLDGGNVDWRMCYTTTDLSDNSASPVLEWKKLVTNSNGSTSVVGTGSRVLFPSTSDKNNIFLTSIDNLPSSGSGNEEGILVMRETFKSSQNQECFRSDAVLSVVLISDEDEKSCGGRCKKATSSENPTGTQYRTGDRYAIQYRDMTAEDNPQNLVDLVNDLWEARPFVVNSIVIRKNDLACYNMQDSQSPAFFGLTYSSLQSITGGILGDICADSYTSQLQLIGQRTRETVNSVTLRCAPAAAPTVTVTPSLPSGVTWTTKGNKIVFSAPIPEGSVVRAKYQCQEPI